jgi:hypothetical protein
MSVSMNCKTDAVFFHNVDFFAILVDLHIASSSLPNTRLGRHTPVIMAQVISLRDKTSSGGPPVEMRRLLQVRGSELPPH